MELLQLQYFVEVAKLGSITNAAEALHISQPALSLSIKRLEAELGVDLFTRVHKRIVLNKTGEALIKELVPILNGLDSINKKYSKLSEERKHIVSLNLRAASSLLIQVIIEYGKINSDIKFVIKHDHSGSSSDFELDVFTPRYGEKLGLNDTVLFEEPFYIIVPKALEKKYESEVSLHELSNETFAMLDSTQPLRSVYDSFCSEAGFTPKVGYESTQLGHLKTILKAGLGVGFWSSCWGNFDSADAVLLTVKEPICRRNVVMRYLPNFLP